MRTSSRPLAWGDDVLRIVGFFVQKLAMAQATSKDPDSAAVRQKKRQILNLHSPTKATYTLEDVILMCFEHMWSGGRGIYVNGVALKKWRNLRNVLAKELETRLELEGANSAAISSM